MKKITFSLIAVAVSAGALLAQSVDQGKNFYITSGIRVPRIS